MSNSEYREAQQQARDHGLRARQEARLENATYTAAEVKVLTEAALRLGRKEAMEEFAATCGRRAQIAERVPEPMRSGVREGMVVTWLAAQRLAEDAAYLAAPDASEPRTDPGMGNRPTPGTPSRQRAAGGRVSNGPIEPSADLREIASFWRQTYVALINEGFTEREAVAILGHIIGAAFNQGGGQ